MSAVVSKASFARITHLRFGLGSKNGLPVDFVLELGSQATAFDDVNARAEEVFEIAPDTAQIEQREWPFHFDEQVDIAIGPVIASRERTENIDVSHLHRPPFICVGTDGIDDSRQLRVVLYGGHNSIVVPVADTRGTGDEGSPAEQARNSFASACIVGAILARGGHHQDASYTPAPAAAGSGGVVATIVGSGRGLRRRRSRIHSPIERFALGHEPLTRSRRNVS